MKDSRTHRESNEEGDDHDGEPHEVGNRRGGRRGVDGPDGCGGRDQFDGLGGVPGDRRGLDAERAGFAATPETNTVVAKFTFGPNSSAGWHTHPGKTLVTVKTGTFTVYHARDCAPSVYGPGDAFVELPSTVHVGRNETGSIVELGVVFFGVPIGGSPRIDQPQPTGCVIT